MIKTNIEVHLVEQKLNLGNAIYKGFNDKNGLMICGYEWGQEADRKGQIVEADMSKKCTFSNKSLRYGDVAKTWIKYDKRIRTWFSMWGHPLNEEGEGNDFDKTIIQTNWALGSKEKSDSINFYLKDENIDNFILHINALKPKLILFMGNQLLTKLLISQKVLEKFTPIMGEKIEKLQVLRMPGYHGALTYIHKFEKCTVIGLPHPSSSRGLTNEYIEFCKSELETIISNFKTEKNIK